MFSSDVRKTAGHFLWRIFIISVAVLGTGMAIGVMLFSSVKGGTGLASKRRASLPVGICR